MCKVKNLREVCYQFHHINPGEKLFNISTGIWNRSFDKLIKEANKCILLCANCHFALHELEKIYNEVSFNVQDKGDLEWIRYKILRYDQDMANNETNETTLTSKTQSLKRIKEKFEQQKRPL